MDVLEAITGDFIDFSDTEAKIFVRDDGSLLVAGWMPVDEFAARIGITLSDDRNYETVAGLLLEKMGTLPAVGAHLDMSGWRIEDVDLDGRRIDNAAGATQRLTNAARLRHTMPMAYSKTPAAAAPPSTGAIPSLSRNTA